MMDESARDWSNTNFSPGWLDRFYVAMCREADYIKAVDGLPLIITFDMASRQDLHLNVLMALAAGQRYTYLTSPGDYAYGPLPKWLTRFSAFVWDKTRRFEEEPVTVATADDRPLWWKESVWLRQTGPETWQVLTSIINPPLYNQFCNRVQPPPVTATNAVAIFRPPAGATVTRAFYLSPELADGWRPLTAAMRDGASVISLPPLHVFDIAGFEFTWSGSGTPFRLRDPAGEAAAVFATQAEETARKAAVAKANASIGAPVEKPVEPDPRADDAFATKNPPPPGWRLERDGALDVLHARGPFYRQILRMREEAANDTAFFFSVALGMKGPTLHQLAAKLANTEKRETLPLAFALAGAAQGPDAAAVRAAFRDAKLDSIRLLGEGR